MSLTIRALLLIWPFLKRALFGDLTIKEVVLANLHITIVYACLCALLYAQLYAIVELSVVKSVRIQPSAEMCLKPDTPTVDTLMLRRKLFGELLK